MEKQLLKTVKVSQRLQIKRSKDDFCPKIFLKIFKSNFLNKSPKNFIAVFMSNKPMNHCNAPSFRYVSPLKQEGKKGLSNGNATSPSASIFSPIDSKQMGHKFFNRNKFFPSYSGKDNPPKKVNKVSFCLTNSKHLSHSFEEGFLILTWRAWIVPLYPTGWEQDSDGSKTLPKSFREF